MGASDGVVHAPFVRIRSEKLITRIRISCGDLSTNTGGFGRADRPAHAPGISARWLWPSSGPAT